MKKTIAALSIAVALLLSSNTQPTAQAKEANKNNQTVDYKNELIAGVLFSAVNSLDLTVKLVFHKETKRELHLWVVDRKNGNVLNKLIISKDGQPLG